MATALATVLDGSSDYALVEATNAHVRDFIDLRGLIELLPAIDVSLKKPVKRAELAEDAEPLIDEYTASAYLGYKPITCLRMAKRGQLPAIAFPIGATGKIRYKFKLSQLQAYTESISRASQAG